MDPFDSIVVSTRHLPVAVRALVLVDPDSVVGGAAVAREEIPAVGGPVEGPLEGGVRGLLDLQFEVVAEPDVAQSRILPIAVVDRGG